MAGCVNRMTQLKFDAQTTPSTEPMFAQDSPEPTSTPTAELDSSLMVGSASSKGGRARSVTGGMKPLKDRSGQLEQQ